jgi:hypothetical protein
MEAKDIAAMFQALKGGELKGMELSEGTLQFQISLPAIAALRGEHFQHFLASLSDVKDISLQPFRNESTEIKNLKQINQLQLHIDAAEPGAGNQVKVFCKHRAGGAEARFSFRASNFGLWDESFDAVSLAEIEALRQQAGI